MMGALPHGPKVDKVNRKIWRWTSQDFTRQADSLEYPEMQHIMPRLTDPIQPNWQNNLDTFYNPYNR